MTSLAPSHGGSMKRRLLYDAPGDELARDVVYSDAMARMYAQWPGDPEVAPLGLPAVRAYAGIAPAAAHALHMPPHVFVQLGMREDVAKSNLAACEAAMEIELTLGAPSVRAVQRARRTGPSRSR